MYTIIPGRLLLLLSATEPAYSYNMIVLWPLPFYPGAASCRSRDLQALALEAMGNPGGSISTR